MSTTIEYSDWQDVTVLNNGIPEGLELDAVVRVENLSRRVRVGKVEEFNWRYVLRFQVEVTDE